MSSRPSVARIPPLAPDDLDAEARGMLDVATGPGTPGSAAIGAEPGVRYPNMLATLVRHPALFRGWRAFMVQLWAGTLPARCRELLILRTGWRCHAEYYWGQHQTFGRAAGLTDQEIGWLRSDASSARWDDFDAAVVRAADELHDDACITDETWSTLAGHLDEQQLVEVLMMVGQYTLVSFALNSLGVQRDPGAPGFE
jgi:4-carboxymuconolactone decarboxylase